MAAGVPRSVAAATAPGLAFTAQLTPSIPLQAVIEEYIEPRYSIWGYARGHRTGSPRPEWPFLLMQKGMTSANTEGKEVKVHLAFKNGGGGVEFLVKMGAFFM